MLVLKGIFGGSFEITSENPFCLRQKIASKEFREKAKFPNAVVLNAVGRRSTQKSANERDERFRVEKCKGSPNSRSVTLI